MVGFAAESRDLLARLPSSRTQICYSAPLPAEVPGAIVRAIIDTLSPLTAGIAEREIPVQFFSDRIYTAPRDVGLDANVEPHRTVERTVLMQAQPGEVAIKSFTV